MSIVIIVQVPITHQFEIERERVKRPGGPDDYYLGEGWNERADPIEDAKKGKVLCLLHRVYDTAHHISQVCRGRLYPELDVHT